MAALSNEWLDKLSSEFKAPYYKDLYYKVLDEYNKHVVFPPSDDIYKAFELTDFSDVKVVIIGQDPYHGDGQAMGLCFSVNKGIQTPPSLANIYKELHDDIGCFIPNNGDLSLWAKQGVLLLNTVLTVRAHEPLSHQGIGWEQFTDAAIRALNESSNPIVFLLWGAPAGRKSSMITNENHLVLKAPHPSPLSAYRGFFGCKHFSKANEFLTQNGREPINWQIYNI